jgi:hypothetical protein
MGGYLRFRVSVGGKKNEKVCFLVVFLRVVG